MVVFMLYGYIYFKTASESTFGRLVAGNVNLSANKLLNFSNICNSQTGKIKNSPFFNQSNMC